MILLHASLGFLSFAFFLFFRLYETRRPKQLNSFPIFSQMTATADLTNPAIPPVLYFSYLCLSIAFKMKYRVLALIEVLQVFCAGQQEVWT